MTPLTYRLIYLVGSTLLALGVAWKMHRNGHLLLADRFPGNPKSAASLNRAITLGTGLLLLGWIIELNGPPNVVTEDPTLLFNTALQQCGVLFLALGFVYLVHVFLISRFGAKSLPAPVKGEPSAV
jgi:hypothetical protein